MASPQYVNVADFEEAYDARLIADLVGDENVRGELSISNPILKTAIERASEDVQMAATVGNRYLTTDLDTMQTDDRWALKGLVVDLAIGHLYDRRGTTVPPAIAEKVEAAKATLDALRNGDEVFPVAANRTAGHVDIGIVARATRPNLNLVSDEPFFPARKDTEY